MNPLKNIDHHSLAGLKGSSVRWANHEKKKTRLVRLYDDDYRYLSEYSSSSGHPVCLLVSRAISHIKKHHGYSVFMDGSNLV